VTAAIRNISVRKIAETHLEQMEGKYRGLLEAAPDAMVVVNQGGEIVLLNVQAEKQFGYRRDELLGQKVTNIIPVGLQNVSSPMRHAPRKMLWTSRSELGSNSLCTARTAAIFRSRSC